MLDKLALQAALCYNRTNVKYCVPEGTANTPWLVTSSVLRRLATWIVYPHHAQKGDLVDTPARIFFAESVEQPTHRSSMFSLMDISKRDISVKIAEMPAIVHQHDRLPVRMDISVLIAGKPTLQSSMSLLAGILAVAVGNVRMPGFLSVKTRNFWKQSNGYNRSNHNSTLDSRCQYTSMAKLPKKILPCFCLPKKVSVKFADALLQMRNVVAIPIMIMLQGKCAVFSVAIAIQAWVTFMMIPHCFTEQVTIWKLTTEAIWKLTTEAIWKLTTEAIWKREDGRSGNVEGGKIPFFFDK